MTLKVTTVPPILPESKTLELALQRMFKRYKDNPASLFRPEAVTADWTQDRDFTICAIRVPGDSKVYMGASKRNPADKPRSNVGMILSFKRAIVDLNREYNFFRRKP